MALTRTRFRVRFTDAYNGGTSTSVVFNDLGAIAFTTPGTGGADVTFVLTITDGPFLPEEIAASVDIAALIGTVGFFLEHSLDGSTWTNVPDSDSLYSYLADDQEAEDVPFDSSAFGVGHPLNALTDSQAAIAALGNLFNTAGDLVPGALPDLAITNVYTEADTTAANPFDVAPTPAAPQDYPNWNADNAGDTVIMTNYLGTGLAQAYIYDGAASATAANFIALDTYEPATGVTVDVTATYPNLDAYTSSTNAQDILEEIAGDLNTLTAANRSWAYSAGRRGNNINLSQDLRNAQNVPTNLSPFLVLEDATIYGWSAYATSSGGGTDYQYDILVNDVSIAGFPRTVASGTNTDFTAALAVDVSAGDEIRIRYLYNDDPVDMIHADVYLVAR